MAFTALPVFVMGVFDQHLSRATLLKLPHVYSTGQRNESFNMRVFYGWVFDAILHSAIIFFIVASSFAPVACSPGTTEGAVSGHVASTSPSMGQLGTVVFSCVMITISASVSLVIKSWNWIIR